MLFVNTHINAIFALVPISCNKPIQDKNTSQSGIKITLLLAERTVGYLTSHTIIINYNSFAII
jgi:hypothetical protein